MTAEAAATTTTTFLCRHSCFCKKTKAQRVARRSCLPYHSPRIRISDFLTASDAAALRFSLRFIAKSLREGRRVPRSSFVFPLFLFSLSCLPFLRSTLPASSLSRNPLAVILHIMWMYTTVRCSDTCRKKDKNEAARSAIEIRSVPSLICTWISV